MADTSPHPNLSRCTGEGAAEAGLDNRRPYWKRKKRTLRNVPFSARL